MELTYNELRNRDVINIVDGTCLGKISDLRISFPRGIMTGIYVPGRKGFFQRFFDKKQIYIDRSRIIKIGGDVILVNINCGESCSPSISDCSTGEKRHKIKPPCQPVCPPPCPPKSQTNSGDFNVGVDFSILSNGARIDDEDY